ncbi:hypothetical protein BJ508DRAFT_307666 [Ascobolus immersus RN42]|uniref:Uncharacterized protein n=1 Tax=Ascobolus immersus RN42 TaxID=1160509 RepID=A0A3N4I3Y6_ASCIM|nr:hypothetical protein BJ508DRAFT_307666 [Ascobolus immersus RN42]
MKSSSGHMSTYAHGQLPPGPSGVAGTGVPLFPHAIRSGSAGPDFDTDATTGNITSSTTAIASSRSKSTWPAAAAGLRDDTVNKDAHLLARSSSDMTAAAGRTGMRSSTSNDAKDIVPPVPTLPLGPDHGHSTHEHEPYATVACRSKPGLIHGLTEQEVESLVHRQIRPRTAAPIIRSDHYVFLATPFVIINPLSTTGKFSSEAHAKDMQAESTSL